MAKRLRKFGDGGSIGKTMAPEDMNAKLAEMGVGQKAADAAAEPATFGAAFAAARKAGGKTFTWKGKSYTTQTKEESAPKTAAPKAAPAPSRPAASAAPKPRANSAAVASTLSMNAPAASGAPAPRLMAARTASAPAPAAKAKPKPKSANAIPQASRGVVKKKPSKPISDNKARTITAKADTARKSGQRSFRDGNDEYNVPLVAGLRPARRRKSFAKGGTVRGSGCAKRGY